MYLLYYKHVWTVEKVDAWLGSSQIFFGNLQKDPLNNSWKFYVIDCDFGHLHCGNISQPTIHEYRNGKLTSSNYVVTVGETQTCREALIQCSEARNHSEALCNAKHACLNGGTLNPSAGDEDFLCICKPGYSGNQCETVIDICESNSCQNNGWCQNKLNSYTCKCQLGFAGENCAVSIDWCALEEAPCKHGGMCRNKQLGFTCDCVAPWTGQLCENKVDPCILHACLNGATCAAAPSLLDYLCHCKDGYNGPFCEINIDECALNTPVCLNGGSCVDQVNGFFCTCLAGFNGPFCEIDIDECNLNPNVCLNGGTCVDQVDGFKCTCPVGFQGRFCDCKSVPANVLEAQPELKPTSLDCGGLIPFPSHQRYHLFTFEATKIDSTNNRCLWTFNNVRDGHRSSFKPKVTLLCSRFREPRSHLSLHNYKAAYVNDDLLTFKLTGVTKKVELTDVSSTGLFLSFVYQETNERVKFTILVDANSQNFVLGGSVNSYNDVSGSQTFGSFSHTSFYTIFSMAVNPAKTRTTLSLDLFQTSKTGACGDSGNLDVYEISGKDKPKRLGRFCNSLTSSVSFTSEFPLLTLQYSHPNTQLKISWK